MTIHHITITISLKIILSWLKTLFLYHTSSTPRRISSIRQYTIPICHPLQNIIVDHRLMNDAISSLWKPTASKHRLLIWRSIWALLTTEIRHVAINCENKAGTKWLTFVSSCQSGRLHSVIQRSPGTRPHPVARTSSPDQQKESWAWDVWWHSVCQGNQSLSCVTYPGDKWAQHELIQAGQKNSTLHR